MKAAKIILPETVYNSHGQFCSWEEMRETEVTERNNYTMRTFRAWEKKYNIKPSDRVIWITPDKKMAYTYAALAQDYDKIMGMTLKEVEAEFGADEITEIESNTGYIIPESDDGDNGYIFVVTKPDYIHY